MLYIVVQPMPYTHRYTLKIGTFISMLNGYASAIYVNSFANKAQFIDHFIFNIYAF